MTQLEASENSSTIYFFLSILALVVIAFGVAYICKVGIFGARPWDYFLALHFCLASLATSLLMGILYFVGRSKKVLRLSVCYAVLGFGGLLFKFIITRWVAS